VIYFDTSYLVRLYLEDTGYEVVRGLATQHQLACCLHGYAEVVAALHRRMREGAVTQKDFQVLLEQFEEDCKAGAITWLPLSAAVVARLTQVYGRLPKTGVLRSADAIHLACAAEKHLSEIYSNDQRLLAAAGYFGITGRNVF
jgi:predicted nucleic acid-binding protein